MVIYGHGKGQCSSFCSWIEISSPLLLEQPNRTYRVGGGIGSNGGEFPILKTMQVTESLNSLSSFTLSDDIEFIIECWFAKYILKESYGLYKKKKFKLGVRNNERDTHSEKSVNVTM